MNTSAKKITDSSAVGGKATVDIPTLSDALPVRQKKSSFWSWLAVYCLVLLLALAGVGAVLYLLQQQQRFAGQFQSSLQKFTGVMEQKDRQLEQLQSTLRQQSLDADKQQQRMQEQLGQLQKQLTAQQTHLQALSVADQRDWLVAEVEYLLRLANQRVLMGGDLSGAQALLATADSIVNELDDMALFSVRQQIAKDLAAVRAVETVDAVGIYARLSAMIAQVDKLPLFTPPDGNKAYSKVIDKVEAESADTGDGSWYQRVTHQLISAFDKLAAALGIRVQDLDARPLLPPEQNFYLRQNLRLMLEQAKAAMLSGNQTVYADSLDRARQWLAQYFQLSGPATGAVLAELDALSALRIASTLPDISESQRVMKVYSNTRHNIVGRSRSGDEIPLAARSVESVSDGSSNGSAALNPATATGKEKH